MELLLMSRELLGGMFSYSEAKHMLAISLSVCVCVCVYTTVQYKQCSPKHTTSTAPHYPAPPASKEGLLSKAELHPYSLFEKDYGILGGPVVLRDKAL